MGAVGSSNVVNWANTNTGYARQVNAETYLEGGIGQSVGGSGLSTTYPSPSPTPIVLNYLAIQDSAAVPNDVFQAQYSSDLGNNTGWVISSGPFE